MKRYLCTSLTIIIASLLLTGVARADTVYLRDGRAIRGTVLGFIGGRFVVRVGTTPTTTRPRTASPEESGDVQFFRPREIDRVEIDNRSLDEARYNTQSVQVALGANWVDSGVDVERGQRVQVRASGTIVAGRTRITPDGLRGANDPVAPLPRAAEGLLIGALSNDPNAPIIELGSTREFTADRDGRLYLTANRSNYTDAQGSFDVRIRTERDLAPPRRNPNDTARRSNDADEDDGFDDPFGTRRNDPAPTRPRNSPNDPRDRDDTTRDPLDSRDPRNTRRNRQELSATVPGNSNGTDTRLDVRQGDTVTITATGTIATGRRSQQIPPSGGRAGFGAVLGSYPVPNAGVGALIGVLRTTSGEVSQPFLVGNSLTFTAPADGRLILAINDDNLGDNSGSFNVTVRVE